MNSRARKAMPAILCNGFIVVDSNSSYRALLTLITRLHACATVPELEIALTEQLTSVIPADGVTLNRIDLTGNLGGSLGIFHPEYAPPSVIQPAFDRYMHQHPLVAEFIRTGDGHPRRMSDFTDMAAFRRTDLYEQVFLPMNSLHQIAFSVVTIPGMVIGIGINRASRDFTDDELELAGSIFEQLPAAFHHVQLREVHDREAQLAPAPELSGREREVLLYVRAGMSNRQIAASMVVGQRTVEKHLERLYAKLGVRTRTGAINAVWPPLFDRSAST